MPGVVWYGMVWYHIILAWYGTILTPMIYQGPSLYCLASLRKSLKRILVITLCRYIFFKRTCLTTVYQVLDGFVSIPLSDFSQRALH